MLFNTHTHTHTYTHVSQDYEQMSHFCVCVCVCVCVCIYSKHSDGYWAGKKEISVKVINQQQPRAVMESN